MNRRWMLVLLLCSFAAPLMALSEVSSPLPLETRAWNVIQQSWALTDRYLAYVGQPSPENEQAFDQAMSRYQQSSEELGRTVAASLETREHLDLTALSDLYRSLDPANREALHPTLAIVRAAALHAATGPVGDRQLREYFPGYGYSESGYKYRRGRELDREFKGTTWQDEEQTLTLNTQASLVINLDLLAMFQGLASSGAIRDLKVGRPFEMTPGGGAPILAVNISFSANKVITTKTTRKFDVNKIWFELMRAKGTLWTSGPWENVGKTYVIAHEATGDHVVTAATPQ